MRRKLITLLLTVATLLSGIAVPVQETNAADITTIPISDTISLNLSWPIVTQGSARYGNWHFNGDFNSKPEYIVNNLPYYEIVPGTIVQFPDGYTWTKLTVYRQDSEYRYDFPNYLPTDYFFYRWFDADFPNPAAAPKKHNFDEGWIDAIVCVTVGDLNGGYLNEYGEMAYPTVGEVYFKIRNPFSDVKFTDWYHADVIRVYHAGIMTGLDFIGGIFGPYEMVSRAQFAVMLYRMEGSPAIEGTSPFPDIEEDTWYTNAAIWAANNGIITGYNNGCFGPADLITREQMATMIHRYGTLKGHEPFLEEPLEQFSDYTSISSFAMDSMYWAVNCNLIRGKEGSLIAPQATASRGECAAILSRYLTAIDGRELYI